MKKIVLLLVLAIICSFSFIHCNKCHSKKIGNLRLTESDLNIIPYKGTGDIIFRDSINNEICYHPDPYYPRESFYEDKYDNHIRNRNGDYEPCGNYYNAEENVTKFHGKQCYTYIEIQLSFDSIFNNIRKYFHILVSYEKGEQWAFSNGFYFDSGIFYDYRDTNTVCFNDSLQIGPTRFHNVFTFKQNGGNIGYELIQYLYYSFDKGIVGFKNKNGHLWYLAS